jgi:hypothetical protein
VQQQQQEQEEPILWPIETPIRRGVSVVLQPYCHVLPERRREARQTTILSYFKKKPEGPPNDSKMAEDDPVDHDDL